jgi:hypothetical protein
MTFDEYFVSINLVFLQLNAKLNGKKIRVLNAFFLNNLLSEGYRP